MDREQPSQVGESLPIFLEGQFNHLVLTDQVSSDECRRQAVDRLQL